MKSWIGSSLKHKLSVLIVIAVMLPVIFLGIFAYQISSRLSEEKAKMSGMNILHQLQVYLDYMITDAENMSLFIIGDEGIQRYLQNPVQLAREQMSVINLLMNSTFSKNYIANIVVEPSLYDKPIIEYMSILHTDLIAQEPPPGKAKWWSPVSRSQTSLGTQKIIALVRPIRSVDKFKDIGKLQIHLDQEVISKHLGRSELDGNGYVLLLDENDRILAGPDHLQPGMFISEAFPDLQPLQGKSGFLNAGTGKDKNTIVYYNLSKTDWKLVGVIPFQAYSSENRYFLTLTAIAVLVATLFVVGVVFFLIRTVTKPLTEVSNILKRSRPDAPIPTLPVASLDEVGQLILSYNKMTSRVQQLTEQVARNEALKKEADIQALQAQINPHFLYNTLSSVHWMALMDKKQKIADMVGALSDFLRFSLNKGQEFCTVSQEIAHVRNYTEIQSIRYPGRFHVEIYADEEINEQMMLKLLLQPLIENAMLHGILRREGEGVIEIRAELAGEEMWFSVTDNGVGIPEQKLCELQDILAGREVPDIRTVSKEGSYGLLNVHSRLKLHYGEQSGLTIESTQGVGTMVSFSISQREEGEQL